jgi:O-antigen/teichoic acid export membrane protein
MMSSHRIVLNAAATYTRTVLAAGLALFSSRWVLDALGQSDYGLFSVVGSIIIFITILNRVMSVSSIRHFAFAIGKGDSDEVNKWFNASLSIYLILPVTLILIGWPVGEYCIRHVLTVPHGRIPACLWVFRLSLITAFFAMVSVPYMAMYAAQQYIAELALWGTLQSAFMFTFAYMLTKVTGDRLIFYTGYTVAIGVLFAVIQVIRARCLFSECRCHLARWFDHRLIKELFSFAIWNLFGSFGNMVRLQGSAILLNLFFGTKVNAAYGIANTVANQTSSLSAAMFGALSPEITASEGSGDRVRVLDFALRACKFVTLLMFFFAIPLMAEVEYVLLLWLRKPPQYTPIFCKLMMVMLLLDFMTIGHMMAVNACGKIRAFSVTIGIIHVFTIPLAWVFLRAGFAPTTVSIALVTTCGLGSLGRVFWARRLLQMPARRWVTEVFIPCAMVAAGASIAAVAPRWFMPQSFLRLCISTAASVAVTGVLGWFAVLNHREKLFVIESMGKAVRKLSNGMKTNIDVLETDSE